ncbi:hypothetical protein KC799_02490 [candidate division KSB1 bacterium]|nr:hypothetical protein [candidate division KSB1 bacterium]
MTKKNILLGEFLLEQGLINEEQLKQALEYHNKNGTKLGRAFIELNILTENEIIKSLSNQLGVQYINLKNYRIDEDVLKLISAETAWNYYVFPLFRLHNRLSVAMVNPLDVYALDELTRTTKLKIEPVIAMEADILQALQEYYASKSHKVAVEASLPESSIEQAVTVVEQGREQDNFLAQIDAMLEKLVRHQAYKAVVIADKLKVFKANGLELWDLPEDMDAANFIRVICNLGDDMYPGERGPKRFQIQREIGGKNVRFHLFSLSASQYSGLAFHIQMGRPNLEFAKKAHYFKQFNSRKLPIGLTIVSTMDETLLNDSFYSLLKKASMEFNIPLSIETQPTHLLPDVIQATCIHKNEQIAALQYAELSGVDCLFLKDIHDPYALAQALTIAERGAAVVLGLQSANPLEILQTRLRETDKVRLAQLLQQIYINLPLEQALKIKPDFHSNLNGLSMAQNGNLANGTLLEAFWTRDSADHPVDSNLIFENISSGLRKKLREEVTRLGSKELTPHEPREEL